ncbi:MAG: TIM barrel protein [Bacteroidota bacterium]
MKRRDFLKTSAIAGGVGTLAPWVVNPAEARTLTTQPADDLELNIFSKHLEFLDYDEMARVAKAMGFDGVDLTVRETGHVEPENVIRDLPRAVDAIEKYGLNHDMMTTFVDDASNSVDRRVLQTASEQGIRFYRMNWFRYDENQSMPESIAHYRQRIHELDRLNQGYDLVGCYQNHAGTLVGASLWEIHEMLQDADPETFGVQYDLRHAVVEGGLSWENGLRLIAPRIRTLVLKDVKWSQQPDGAWYAENVPFGEGMVDWAHYFKLLKEYNIQVPVSVHFEYPLGGANRGNERVTIHRDRIYQAMIRDVEAIRNLWDSV